MCRFVRRRDAQNVLRIIVFIACAYHADAYVISGGWPGPGKFLHESVTSDTVMIFMTKKLTDAYLVPTYYDISSIVSWFDRSRFANNFVDKNTVNNEVNEVRDCSVID